MKRIVVVVPTLNEEGNIGKLVEEILDQQKKLKNYSLHVIVADSHSQDKTQEEVETIAKKHRGVYLLDVKRIGIGVGLVKGHLYALDKLGADILVQLDGDGQSDPKQIPEFIKEIENGYDLVIGSRLVKGGTNELDWHRRIFTLGASWVMRLATRLFDIKEFTNSYRAFTAETFRKLNLDKIPWEKKTFIYQPSFLWAAVQTGAKYIEIPIVFRNRPAGYSKNKTIHYIIDVFQFAFGVCLKRWGTLIKFALVGLVGAIINILFYRYSYPVIVQTWPPLQTNLALTIASATGAEIAVVSNFVLNSYWTFRQRRVRSNVLLRFLQFNATSLGSIAIQAATVYVLSNAFGGTPRIRYQLVGIALGFFVNFFVNHFIIFKHQEKED